MKREEQPSAWVNLFLLCLQRTAKGWRRRKKTHASSPSTSGKTHEKTCPIQTRRETRESLPSRCCGLESWTHELFIQSLTHGARSRSKTVTSRLRPTFLSLDVSWLAAKRKGKTKKQMSKDALRARKVGPTVRYENQKGKISWFSWTVGAEEVGGQQKKREIDHRPWPPHILSKEMYVKTMKGKTRKQNHKINN